jgi:hypothetical protein
MFRVPRDDDPTQDEKVPFLRWLRSTRAERLDWQARRRAAGIGVLGSKGELAR